MYRVLAAQPTLERDRGGGTNGWGGRGILERRALGHSNDDQQLYDALRVTVSRVTLTGRQATTGRT